MSVTGGASDVTTERGEASTTTLPGAGTAEELLRQLGIDVSQFQFGAIQQQGAFQDFLGGAARDLFSPEAIGKTEALAGQAGQLTPEEEALISQIEEQSIASGESDINRFTEEGLGLLKQEVGPSRGLRFGDAPILDRGGRLVGEGIRQQGQLQRDVRGRGAQQRLDFPLERQRFQEMLRENSRRFRLGLAGTAGQLGLGFAGLTDPFKQQSLFLAERLGQPTRVGTSKEDTRTYGVSGTKTF